MGEDGTTRAGSKSSSAASNSSAPMMRALGRMSGRAVGSNRFVRAGFSAAQTTVNSVTRVLHTLWLEVTGLFFLVFAVVGAIAAANEFRAYAAGKVDANRAAVAAAFTVLFAYFGISSFWRSRRKSSR